MTSDARGEYVCFASPAPFPLLPPAEPAGSDAGAGDADDAAAATADGRRGTWWVLAEGECRIAGGAARLSGRAAARGPATAGSSGELHEAMRWLVRRSSAGEAILAAKDKTTGGVVGSG